MDFAVIMALLPIVLVAVLLLQFRMAADLAGLWGLLTAALSACFYFGTAPSTVFWSSVAGFIGSLPIAFVMGASIFQITVMEKSGAVGRLVTLMKSTAPGEQVVQLLLINVGFGILLTSLGAVTVSIIPPIMIALGYSAFVAIMLPAVGYDALCIYALLGVPSVVFSSFVGVPVQAAGMSFAAFMPLISVGITLGMLHLAGGFAMVRQGLLPALIAGLAAGITPFFMASLGLVTITGIAAGMAVILSLLAYLKLSGKTLFSREGLTEQDMATEKRHSLAAACSPWILLTVISLIINAPFLPFLELTFQRYAMPVHIIPNSPEKMRIFWQAWFWVIVCTLLALPFLKISRKDFMLATRITLRRAVRPVLSVAVFFALAYVMNQSGKNADWTITGNSQNMITVMAQAAIAAFGSVYPFVAPFLGLIGGFVSGSQSSAIAMFTGLHLSAAQAIGASGMIVAVGSAIGGGLASMVSPSKLLTAAASIDRIDEAGKAMKPAFVLALVMTTLSAVLTMMWAYW